MFATITRAGAVLTFADRWAGGTFQPGARGIDLPLALGSLFLAAIVVGRSLGAPGITAHEARALRAAILTTLSVTAACAALGVVATLEVDGALGPIQASALIGLLAVAIVVRIVVNQVRGSQAQRAVQDALDQKEVALRETDKALARLQRANETLRESEERLRTVFEAAVDGIVELDHKDVIVRANGAFCAMIDLPQALVEGQPWTALAASIEADETFGSLPTTGQGTLRREGHAVYLESRMSEIPGDPPRRLLLVRDVTAARVADQTIRSLFKFLQDRDEDRTRIMRRTNAAIESERNRIARDLHDGPVQGVSAASLSLEAVLLMLKAGDLSEGVEVLSKVRRELSEEADNLRRLMSGLRPPLLEERGLIPALRETVDKYGRDNDVVTEFTGRATVEIPRTSRRSPTDRPGGAVEQREAREGSLGRRLGGSGRRAAPDRDRDDGAGFDAAKAREYLQMGRVGLASMRERVELANGTFMVHSTPGKGTTVLATLPLDAVPAPREFSVSEASSAEVPPPRDGTPAAPSVRSAVGAASGPLRGPVGLGVGRRARSAPSVRGRLGRSGSVVSVGSVSAVDRSGPAGRSAPGPGSAACACGPRPTAPGKSALGHVRGRLGHEVVPDQGRDRAAEDGRVSLDVLEGGWSSNPTQTQAASCGM